MDNFQPVDSCLASVPQVTEVWAVPGYDVQSLLGYGSTAEVWRAVELATGDPVALKRLKPGADPDAIGALRREAHVLSRLDTPYVVRLRAILGDSVDTVLVLDLAAGGSLAALLVRRGPLDPSEVVTLAGPIAQALSVAHAQGIVHGDVTPSNILFTADGMPLLADLGLARLAGDRGAVQGTAEYVDPVVAAGGLPDAAADVWSLAAVCHHLLAGSPPHEGDDAEQVLDAARDGGRAPLGLLAPTSPRPLVAAIEQALAADPAARPDAAAFAAAVRRSHAAAPVRLGGARPLEPQARATHAVHPGQPLPPVESPDRFWQSPRTWALTGAAALLLLAAAVGWVWGHADPQDVPAVPAVTASTAKAGPPPWAQVLDSLDAARAAALRDADETALLQVYAPGSRGLGRDIATVRRLREAGQRAAGVRHTVRSVQQMAYDGRSARLRVTDQLAAYTVTGADGPVSRVAARAAAEFQVVLALTAQGWRLVDVEPVT